jgi:xanthine/uracil permease
MESMLEKGYNRSRNKPERKENRAISMAARLLLYAGVLVIVSGLIYMLINLNKSDSIFHIWLPYIVTGIAMVCISLILKSPLIKPRK